MSTPRCGVRTLIVEDDGVEDAEHGDVECLAVRIQLIAMWFDCARLGSLFVPLEMHGNE